LIVQLLSMIFFFKMTDFFGYFQNAEELSKFGLVLAEGIEKSKGLKKALKEKGGDKEIAEIIGEMLKRKPNVLMVMDEYRQELPMFLKAYTETWGEMVKPVEMKKYASNGDILVTVKPDFASLHNGKKPKADFVAKKTEQAHLETVSPIVKEVYEKIKTELLKQDKGLIFNVQQNYISMKKNRNLAFFHLRKKNLYLVVMCAEKEVRKVVKHNVIKTLPPSVQKFWNGDSTGIRIEQASNLTEVINLLKKVIKE
jgi:predicted transport protein